MAARMKYLLWNFFFIACFLTNPVFAQNDSELHVIVKEDVLSPAKLSSARIEGVVGQKIDSCIVNGVMAKNYGLYTVPFRDKLDNGGGFAGEFWGKWFTSAALAYGYQPDKTRKSILDKSISALTETQEADGRISSYSKDKEFGFWDIWGRKYVLLGLIADYDQTGNTVALQAACRATDALIDIAGPGKKKLTETGLQILEGLSSCSILEPIVLVYERSGNKKYLDFAKYLVQLWSEPNKYNPHGIRLIEEALAGTDPINIAAPKGYEMISCYEGLCELYRVTGDKKLLEAVTKFGEKVLQKEIMIVGSGSSGELWCDGADRQTEILEQPMETCVTVTWMKLCYQLLRLTGNPEWADQLEISLYNALFGAMIDGGKWWAYFSPLIGERMPSPMQVRVCRSSCCVANGPRGMLITPYWSVMKGKDGPVINLYSKGAWSQMMKNNTEVRISQETDYPVNGEILINIDLPKPDLFTISLRIPAWSNNTKLIVNNEEISCQAGSYAQIRREWKKGDKIRLDLDLKGRIVRAPGSVNDLAIMRGPIVLALDNRLVKEANYNLWLLPSGTKWNYKDELGGLKYVLPVSVLSTEAPQQYIDLIPVKSKPSEVWMVFEVPFLYRYTHFFDHKQINLVMCDYASAGNKYSDKNLFRVWLPQPLFMNNIFPQNTWRILNGKGETRPGVPSE
jgi:uncharacterized protein